MQSKWCRVKIAFLSQKCHFSASYTVPNPCHFRQTPQKSFCGLSRVQQYHTCANNLQAGHTAGVRNKEAQFRFSSFVFTRLVMGGTPEVPVQ
ncbi:hypothetical protein GDO81_024077 [Engystomops pustulosus]|uniref:Uncharacterized protein n=1 Tax=Engystomops pustulosus TaxID=76066 RepID=A0AAV6YPQ2_ENGPU|nr:hypothetical protein GDO81_024077 [Engystomops pustulosus]